MKKISRFLFMSVLVVCLAMVASCTSKKEKSGTGYGLVHGENYVGIATMKVKGDTVTELSFEEVFLPTMWAQINTDDVSVDESLIVKNGNATVAKYIIIGDKRFVGEQDSNGNVVYHSTTNDITDLKAWIKASEENAKWYADTLLEGNVKVANAEFEAQDIAFSGNTKDKLKKSTSGYWPEGGVGLGWKKNMEELAKTLVGSKMNFDESKIVLEGSTWKFDQIQSAATLVDAKDYYAVAKRAYNNALNK